MVDISASFGALKRVKPLIVLSVDSLQYCKTRTFCEIGVFSAYNLINNGQTTIESFSDKEWLVCYALLHDVLKKCLILKSSRLHWENSCAILKKSVKKSRERSKVRRSFH